MPTLSTLQRDRQLLDELPEAEPEPFEELLEALLDDDAELSDFVDGDELPSDDEEPLSDDEDEPESFVLDAAVDVADFLPRLSVLKNPDPLNVTPTGVKTFFTGRTSPLSGWAISVRFSSWKPCWTSMVSPVSTNL
ncbi:MAG TPA: hypothetical protein VMW33_03075 [Ilumatobacteraceae bacterium]|nr:hypothetical protein [Ilumatobacteraceae bacterium]